MRMPYAAAPPAPSGLLVVDKPVGGTSFDVIRTARKRLQTKKIGHAGTLDPFASGVLLLAVGPATKALTHLLKADKTYRTTVVFGAASDTLDTDGEVAVAPPPAITGVEVAAALVGFHGETMQVPPQYSAVKVGGKAAYRHARAGETVELTARPVHLHDAELLEFDTFPGGAFAGLPFADIRLHTGSGFYVRSLARDLGAALGTTAICSQLRRERVGRFALAGAIPPDAITPTHLFALTPADFAFPAVELSSDAYADFTHGRRVPAPPELAGQVSVFCEGRWCGFAKAADGWAQPRTVVG